MTLSPVIRLVAPKKLASGVRASDVARISIAEDIMNVRLSIGHNDSVGVKFDAAGNLLNRYIQYRVKKRAEKLEEKGRKERQKRYDAGERARLLRDSACRFSTKRPFLICSDSVLDNHVNAAIRLACSIFRTPSIVSRLHADSHVDDCVEIWNQCQAGDEPHEIYMHRGFGRFSLTAGYETDKINITTPFVFTDLENSNIERDGGASISTSALFIDVGCCDQSHDTKLLCLQDVIGMLFRLKEKSVSVKTSTIFIVAAEAKSPNVSIMNMDTPERWCAGDDLTALTGCNSVILVGFEKDIDEQK